MNHQKVYEDLINKAKNKQKLNEYQELHHILPKSMGGSDALDNLVFLTAREHFIVHALLAHIYDNNQMWSAFIIMKGREHYFNSRLYEIAKKNKSKAMLGNQYAKGIKLPDHVKDAVRESNKKRIRTQKMIEKCTFAGKNHTQEHKEYMKEKMTGRQFSEDTRQKMREAQIKRFKLNPMSNETKEKMSKSKKKEEDVVN